MPRHLVATMRKTATLEQQLRHAIDGARIKRDALEDLDIAMRRAGSLTDAKLAWEGLRERVYMLEAELRRADQRAHAEIEAATFADEIGSE